MLRESSTDVFDEVALRGVRALIIEDDIDGRDLIEEILSQFGAEVRGVSSGAEGLAALKTFAPSVIITDIHMPVESGFHFIQRLRALTVEEGGLTPTVAMSGGSSARETLKAGFCAHLTKPMDIRALLEVTQEFGMVRESGTRNKRGASASR